MVGKGQIQSNIKRETQVKIQLQSAHTPPKKQVLLPYSSGTRHRLLWFTLLDGPGPRL